MDDAHNCIEYCCKDEEWCFILVVGRELLNNEMCTSCDLCEGGLQPSDMLNIDIPNSSKIGITILFSIKRLRYRGVNLYEAVGFDVNCSSPLLSLAWGRGRTTRTFRRLRLFVVDGVSIIALCSISTLQIEQQPWCSACREAISSEYCGSISLIVNVTDLPLQYWRC